MANEKSRRKGGRKVAGGAAAALQASQAFIDPSELKTSPGIPLPAGFEVEEESDELAPVSADQLASEPALAAVPTPPRGVPAVTARSTGSLASRVADAAAAKLLLFDELPADEKPRGNDKVLLVGIVWGGETLIELEQIAHGGDLKVGKLFDLPASNLPKDFRLVRQDGDGLVFTLPADLKSEVHHTGGRKVDSFEALCTSGKARRVDAPFKGYAYSVQDDDRVVVRIAPQLTLIARYVRAGRQKDRALLETLDVTFASTLVVALLVLGLFWLMLRITPHFESTAADDLSRNQPRFTKYQVKPPESEKLPKLKDLSGVQEGAKAKEKEGKFGKDDAKKKDADASKKGAPVVDPNKSEKDRKIVMKKGLLAALSKLGATSGGAASNVLGPGGLGSGINNALGGVKGGAGQGDAYGVGGLGSRGSGSGGGGTALGIGGLGTKGSGHGKGGYGEVDLGGRGKDETQFVPGKTTVVGGLSRDVINRVIQRHYNEIKYCYEKELTKDPGLYGKVTVLFVIEGSGRVGDALVQQTTMSSEPVESCMVNHVKRWMFPQPQGGGTVQVTYPYVFKASGQ